MKVGLFAPLVTPIVDLAYLETLAQGAESRGFSSLWFGEHVVVFDDDPSPYPYTSDGRMPGVAGGRGLPEMFTTLAFLAARTQRIRLGAGAVILPNRHPVLTAKEAATVDWLSGGRLDLGVGVGWSRDECRAMGVPWERRGDRTDAYLELMSRLWCDEISEYSGEFYNLPPCRCDPKPVQPNGLPIWIASDNRRGFHRLARFGHGWYAMALTPVEIADRLAVMAPILAEYGRTLADVEIQICPYTKPMQPGDLARYRDVGVTQVLVTVSANTSDQLVRRLDRAAQFVEAAVALD